MFMRTLMAGAFVIAGAAVQAGTLDFAGSEFATTFPQAGDPDSVANVTVDGVDFTVTAQARGTNGFRQNSDGLGFGVPGNGMYSISIVASADVMFESLTGIDRAILSRTTASRFDGTAGGVGVFDDLAIPTALGSVDFADFTLTAGDVFNLAYDFTDRTGFNSIFASATISGLSFSKVVTDPGTNPNAVPLPAGMPLLLAGLGAFAWVRRRQT